MSTAVIILIVIGALMVLLIAWIISTQRQFVHIDELCQNALGQIAVQLNSRWDAVQSLVQLTAQYARHESETLRQVVEQRRLSNVTTAAQVNEQQTALSQVMGRLIAVGEAYPELKADGVFRETMAGIKDWEEKVRMSRMVYNDTATKMNRMVRQIPTSLIAPMLGFKEREYLTTDEPQKQSYPNINDAFRK